MSKPPKRLDPIRRDSLYVARFILGANQSGDKTLKALTRLTEAALRKAP